MKTLLKPLAIAFLAIAVMSISSCDDNDDADRIPDADSAFDITVNNPNFTLLNAALVRTNLDEALDGEGNFTVFAPTNTAFENFLDANNFESIDDVPEDLLRSVLLYHVLGTTNTSATIATGYTKTASFNANDNAYDMFINTTDGILINGSTNVDLDQADQIVSNGVVHAVDEVIALPTVVTLAAANPMFSNLAAALTQEGLLPALSNNETTGEVPSPFTVFAPTNAAFQALIDADSNDGISSIEDILALDNLSDILLYHVVSGAAVREENITDGLVADPITAGTFVINTTNGVTITDGSSTVTNIVTTNVTGTNGVVHAINFVLRPE